jgi:hypothetical protein
MARTGRTLTHCHGSSSVSLPTDDKRFFSDIRSKARRSRREREAEVRSIAKFARRRHRMKQLLHLAANGSKDDPVSGPRDELLIDSATWAQHIVRLARAWRVCTGTEALTERPLPDTGLGIEAAHRIFTMALTGASQQRIAEALDIARRDLGDYIGELFTPVRYHDSRQQLAGYFRQLDRYHDGVHWSPPNSATARRSTPRSSADSTASPPPEPQDPPLPEVSERGLLPAQEERVRRVLSALLDRTDEFLTRKAIRTLGLPPQTVDVDCRTRGSSQDRRSGGAGAGQVQFRRSYLITFVRERWIPKL